MKTANGIYVDVIRAADGLAPLPIKIDNGVALVNLVRMPHGPFKLRVMTPHQTDVEVVLDNVEIATLTAMPGMVNIFDRNPKTGRFFTFSQDGTQVSEQPEDNQPSLFGDVAGEKPAHQTSGFLAVSVSFTPRQPGEVHLPADVEEVLFQMNPPEAHSQLVAESFHRIVPAEAPATPQCSCCKHY